MLFRVLYQFPTWIQRLYRKVTWRRPTLSREVYLTFDDGPIPEVTPDILRILKEKGVKATFFVVGDNVRKSPHLLEAILRDGHRVGNHTFHHLPGLHTSLAEYLQDVSQCDEVLAKHGDMHPRLMRPPYGRMSAAQKREIINAGYEIILWDVLTHDYNPDYSPEKMLRVVTRYTRPGSIVVLHDSLKSHQRMLTVLPQLIDWWHDNGYQLKVL